MKKIEIEYWQKVKFYSTCSVEDELYEQLKAAEEKPSPDLDDVMELEGLINLTIIETDDEIEGLQIKEVKDESTTGEKKEEK